MGNALHNLTYVDAEELFAKNKIALLPVGSVEQHGPANPLGTDMLIAEKLAAAAAQRADVILLPTVPFGVSYHHMAFPGTVTVSETALENYLFEILRSLAKWGVTKVLVVNGHGGNLPTLQILARRAREELGVRVFVYQWWTHGSRYLKELFDEEEQGHAASAETSLVMYLYPELVRRDRLLDESPKGELNGGPLHTFKYTHELSRSGVFGKQTSATTERGRLLFEKLVAQLIDLINLVTNE